MYKLPLYLLLTSLTLPTFSQREHNSAKLTLGTTILAFLSPDTAWLASDTKLLEVNTDKHDTTQKKETKIYKNKSAYYGFCGIGYFSSSDLLLFDPKKILDSLLSMKKTLKETYETFNNITFSKVNKVANWLFKNSRREYDKNIGVAIFSYILLGYENNKLQCFSVAYEINNAPMGLNRIKVARNDIYTGDTTLFFLGYAQEVRQMLSSGLRKFNIKNVKNELSCLIQIESNLHEDYVGMPADQYIVYRNGFKLFKNVKCFTP